MTILLRTHKTFQSTIPLQKKLSKPSQTVTPFTKDPRPRTRKQSSGPHQSENFFFAGGEKEEEDIHSFLRLEWHVCCCTLKFELRSKA